MKQGRGRFHVKHPLGPGARAVLERYCALLADAPVSLTAVRDAEELWRLHVEDALTAAPLLAGATGPLVDVGSGGGSPGIPLAVVLGVPVTLLEATGSKAAFLDGAVRRLGLDARVVHARSEQYASGPGREAFGIVVARALAPPPVAAELCLPLARLGGRVVLFAGAADVAAVEQVAALLGAELEGAVAADGRRRLLLLAKTGPTPERFPRRPGVARKRPLVPIASPS